MNISHEKPKNWQMLVERFGAVWGKTVVTYGDTCHCAKPLSEDLMVHEAVHVRQQKNPDEWWARYMMDPVFRVEQEVEAYKEQMDYFRRVLKDRNQLFRIQDKLARDLCGPLYGRAISYDEAFRRIA